MPEENFALGTAVGACTANTLTVQAVRGPYPPDGAAFYRLNASYIKPAAPVTVPMVADTAAAGDSSKR